MYSEGKTFQSAIEDEIDYIIDNELSLESPVGDFLDIREKLIEKYGSIKEASKYTDVCYSDLQKKIKNIETKKKYRPSKSTISMLSKLLEE